MQLLFFEIMSEEKKSLNFLEQIIEEDLANRLSTARMHKLGPEDQLGFSFECVRAGEKMGRSQHARYLTRFSHQREVQHHEQKKKQETRSKLATKMSKLSVSDMEYSRKKYTV